LRHADIKARMGTALVFLEMDDEQAGKALPVLREALKTSEDAWKPLGETLTRKGMPFKRALPLFEEFLEKESDQRIAALRMAGNLGPIAQPVERLVRKAASEDKPDI